MCQCGCRGWCSWFPILLRISRDILLCALGESMDQGDLITVSFLVAILEMRSDWPAWTDFSGLRIWNHNRSPCPKCNIPRCLIASTTDWGLVSLTQMPWEEYGQQQYLEDIEKHRIVTYSMFSKSVYWLVSSMSVSCTFKLD